jgi:predicted nuclease of predicted toxin-antitoxin system
MRFFLDEDLSDAIAVAAQVRGIDIISARQARRGGLTDEEQLLFAAQEERCVISKNAKHFVPLSREFEARGLPHAGVLLVARSLPGERFSAIVEAIQRFNEEHRDGIPPYSVWWLSAERA